MRCCWRISASVALMP